jgi:hypothetical protein
MRSRSRRLGFLILCTALLFGLGSARGQETTQIIDIKIPVPIPFYAGDGYPYPGQDGFDVALGLPQFFQRPLDDLTPRPGADALGMGGAFVSLAEGAQALGWNPAGMASLRGASLFIDGYHYGGSGSAGSVPDTILVPGQPEFGIQTYQDRLAGRDAFGFVGAAGPLWKVNGRPLVGGIAWRRHTAVAYGAETILEMDLLEGTGFPFVLGGDRRERGAIESLTAGLAYEALHIGDAVVSVGATANALDGRLRAVELSRVNVQRFSEGRLTYQTDYRGFSYELGGRAVFGELLRVGAWVGLPYTLKVRDGKFTSLPIAAPNQEYNYRVSGDIADYDLEVPLFASGGVSVGPIHGILVAADVNYRPWSDAEIKHTDVPYQVFDGPYPGADVTSYSLGAEFEFPLFRPAFHRAGLRLGTAVGFRTLPLSMRELDLVGGEAPYYLGSQVEGDAVSLGLSLETGTQISFYAGLERQSYDYRKWFLDDSRPSRSRELGFTDPYDRASTISRGVTVFRFSSEWRL